MTNRAPAVDRFLETLDHPRREVIVDLRAAILASDAGITERIKWNAPSFCAAGDDRVTFRLRPGDIVQLIFHRGVRPKDSTGFTFADPDGLLVWAAPDRGVLTVDPATDINVLTPKIVALVQRWMAATA